MTNIPSTQDDSRAPVRIHAANIVGLGAVQLVQSLLPAMERLPDYRIECLYLPDRGSLAKYQAVNPATRLIRRRRYLPNAISRILECTLFGGRFAGEGSLLVLGDIPIRCKGPQTVFVQTPLLTRGASSNRQIGAIKYWIARQLFRWNSRYASSFIVQTEIMKAALQETYPEITGRVHVIGQPVPEWLLDAEIGRSGPLPGREAGLRLFYPAASYPHKNHQLLSRISTKIVQNWPISALTLTIPVNSHPNPLLLWIKCVDRLTSDEVIQAYRAADALLFLSLSESFGFPLLEAMWAGLPIICPDLPYAHILCGDQAIYFNPADTASLLAATIELSTRLDNEWWPDWREQLHEIPDSWGTVAIRMLQIAVVHNN
jgi:glycosyltransferase involved in cell wall biosynthesis